MNHVIEAVTFSHHQPGEDAPLLCSCGETMQAGDYSRHKAAVGQPKNRTRQKPRALRVNLERVS